MTSIKVLGTGRYLPPLVVTNDDYTQFLDTSDEWIRTRTGMERRHITTGEPTWYLGTQAAKGAIETAGLAPDDIDLIILSTVTPDFYTPSMACMVQNQLGIKEATALDINVACSAFCFALDMARRYLATGDYTNALLIGAESLSQITNYDDRSSAILFGDGAGACVVTHGEGRYGAYHKSDASGVAQLYATIPRNTHPFATDTSSAHYLPFVPEIEGKMVMNGREVYKFATRAMPKAVEEACKKAGVTPKDLKIIIPHQANIRIIEAAAKKLGLGEEKIFVNIQDYGNTSSASAAIGLDQVMRESLVASGDLVCVVGFGAGLTYGATVFQV